MATQRAVRLLACATLNGPVNFRISTEDRGWQRHTGISG
jgi:hypothetical protein